MMGVIELFQTGVPIWVVILIAILIIPISILEANMRVERERKKPKKIVLYDSDVNYYWTVESVYVGTSEDMAKYHEELKWLEGLIDAKIVESELVDMSDIDGDMAKRRKEE